MYATRLYGEDGLEYDSDLYPNLRAAKSGVRAQIAEMRRHGMGRMDYHIHQWRDSRYGEIVAGSDI